MEESTPSASKQFQDLADSAIASGKKISFVTHVLGDSGEAKLKYLISSLLKKYDHVDHFELLYTASRELIVNSTKAAIKRMIFQESNLNIYDSAQYNEGMLRFKGLLNELKFPHYKKMMREKGFSVKVSFVHNDRFIRMSVINNFPLLKIEADRIREKLQHAKKFDNLFEFFLEHGDNTEGAGMGITMVEILLMQSGFPRNTFTITSDEKEKETRATVFLPFEESLLPSDTNTEQLSIQSD